MRIRIQIVLHYARGWGCKRIAKALGIVPSHAIKTAHCFLDYGAEGLEDGRRENGITKAGDDICHLPGAGGATRDIAAGSWLASAQVDAGASGEGA
ncbi:MAG: helix-turn-helix domain-containing protein [Planctomycetota bacterium]